MAILTLTKFHCQKQATLVSDDIVVTVNGAHVRFNISNDDHGNRLYEFDVESGETAFGITPNEFSLDLPANIAYYEDTDFCQSFPISVDTAGVEFKLDCAYKKDGIAQIYYKVTKGKEEDIKARKTQKLDRKKRRKKVRKEKGREYKLPEYI